MKPSVARKLNERIRALEAELEELRSNRKVQELERKLHVSERRGALRLKRRWGRGGAAPSGRGALCVCGAPIHSR